MAFAIAGLSTAATIALVGAGATAATAGGMAIGSNQRRKSRERELDEYAKQSPLYQGSKPISISTISIRGNERSKSYRSRVRSIAR